MSEQSHKDLLSSMLYTLTPNLKLNESLKEYTSWYVGGVAKRYFAPSNIKELAVFLAGLSPNEPLFWLGLGSNVLIRDGGFAGTVIHTQKYLNKIAVIESNNNYAIIRAEAGVPCPKIAKFCADRHLKGAEFFAGIPGTMGGALAMNAGAFGGETWDYVYFVESINRAGQIEIKPRRDYEYGYRHVIRPSESWFVAGYLMFKLDDEHNGLAKISALLKQRKDTQPIGTRNCGSVFRNPPNLHAAKMIDTLGLKGCRIGDAIISLKHANFILNLGEARAKEIEELIDMIKHAVLKRYGVLLKCEVQIIGDDKASD